jgi:hypothetical protein
MHTRRNGFDELTHYVEQVYENVNENLAHTKLLTDTNKN